MTVSRAPVSPEIGWNSLIAEWAAGLFMAPLSTPAVNSYRDGLGSAFLDILGNEIGCKSGAQRMQWALITEASAAAVARKLAATFTVLFDGVGGHRTVSLYESAHVSESGRLFQSPVSDMHLLLRQADMAIDDTFREPADHLSIELALWARLMRAGAGHRAQAALVYHHLIAWVPMFADRCRDADDTGFYAGAARVLAGFLAAQQEAFQARKTFAPMRTVPGDE
jgi:TorA-specific chaperone